MTTWGDFAITAVRYNDDNTRIVKVKRREVHSDHLSSGTAVQRMMVVSGIEGGDDYTTAVKNKNDKWELGDEIHVLPVDGEKFIRTDQSDTKEDNLGGLPRF